MNTDDGLYKDLTYKIIGALYEVHNELGPVHKERVYSKAVAKELKSRNIGYEMEKAVPVIFKGEKVGVYRPDFIVEDRVVLEFKVVPLITKVMLDQIFYYIKGTKYKLALLVNFGTTRLSIKRRIFSK